MSEFVCKSTFCVINNPRYNITYRHNETGEIIKDENGKPEILTQEPTEYYGFTEQQICDDVLNKWVSDGEEHTGAVLYCVSALGLEHLHCVFESNKAYRPLTVLKRLFSKIHIEVTKGSKKDVEDYINKVGKFEEKGEKIIAKSQVGEIIGCQGKRTDLITLDEIKELISEGLTPREIFLKYPKALKEEKAVNWLFFDRRCQDIPRVRNVDVYWLCGRTGCGKSYKYVELCEKYGDENVYLVSDYQHPFDNYIGQDVVVFDEFRGQFRFADMLMYLDRYIRDINARYFNKTCIWTKVYITSPLTPYHVYNNNEGEDKKEQFYRRIKEIVRCFKYEKKDCTVYFQASLPCELDGCIKDIYKEFNDIETYCIDRVKYCNDYKGEEGIKVTYVKKEGEQIEETLTNGFAI